LPYAALIEKSGFRFLTYTGGRTMKTLKKIGAVILMAAMFGGCAYGGVAGVGDKVVITRNDVFLFGVLRKVYVCKVADSGVSDCQTNESP